MAASIAQAQNLFETDNTGHIYEFAPGGTQTTFASGLANPDGLAFNRAGNLFVTDWNVGKIYESLRVACKALLLPDSPISPG